MTSGLSMLPFKSPTVNTDGIKNPERDSAENPYYSHSGVHIGEVLDLILLRGERFPNCVQRTHWFHAHESLELHESESY